MPAPSNSEEFELVVLITDLIVCKDANHRRTILRIAARDPEAANELLNWRNLVAVAAIIFNNSRSGSDPEAQEKQRLVCCAFAKALADPNLSQRAAYGEAEKICPRSEWKDETSKTLAILVSFTILARQTVAEQEKNES